MRSPHVAIEEGESHSMIFITAKFRVRPEHADRWPDITRDFTEATRAEPGCLWFSWSRSVDDPTEYVLVEAFRDDEAGAAHVGSAHFKAAQRELPPHLAETPLVINAKLDQDQWSELGEMSVQHPPAEGGS
jgi:quinol monooxygenase YgiN